MTDNQVVITKLKYQGLKEYLRDATVFINKDEVRMSLDDYLVATHTRDTVEQEAMLNYSFV